MLTNEIHNQVRGNRAPHFKFSVMKKSTLLFSLLVLVSLILFSCNTKKPGIVDPHDYSAYLDDTTDSLASYKILISDLAFWENRLHNDNLDLVAQ